MKSQPGLGASPRRQSTKREARVPAPPGGTGSPGSAARSLPVARGKGIGRSEGVAGVGGTRPAPRRLGRGKKVFPRPLDKQIFVFYRAGIVLAPVPHCAALDVVPGIVRRLGMPCINCSQRLVERTRGSWGCTAFAQLLEQSRGCSVSHKFPCAGKIEF